VTRKSKRELERALEELGSGDAVRDGETFAERHYTTPVTSFVYQTTREVLRLTRNPEIANSDEPIRGLLAVVRKHYGINDDRDDAVLETLRSRAVQAEGELSRPRDAFGSAIVVGPQLLEDADQERFAAAFEADRDDEAARLIVQAVYEWLASRDGRPREVPA